MYLFQSTVNSLVGVGRVEGKEEATPCPGWVVTMATIIILLTITVVVIIINIITTTTTIIIITINIIVLVVRVEGRRPWT